MLAQGQKGVAKGIADDATAAAVNPAAAQNKGLVRKLAEGALVEGALEELPQSVSEQVLQNVALGKPWHEGLDQAAAMGLLAGGAMGAGGAGYHHAKQPKAGGDVDQGGQATPDQPEWTTEPGASPGGLQPVGEVPEAVRRAEAASQFSTSPGAAPEKLDGIAFEREVSTDGLSLADPQQEALPAAQTQPREFDTEAIGFEGEKPMIKPSEAMGLRAADGALSAAAVAAVDSGFSQSLQQAASQSNALPASSPAKAQQQAAQAAQKVQALQGQVNEARQKLLAAMPADMAGQDVDAAMRSRVVPVTLKAQYQMLSRQLADAQQLSQQAQPMPAAAGEQEGALEGVQVLPARGGDAPVLQNRDRSTAASVAQMQEIAANPDYVRTGPSRTMDTGAPVVFGDLPASAVVGRAETVADGMGRRVQAQYAVVDAADVLTSHTADGATVPGYAEGQAGKLRAVAGNGRAAGIAAAHERGTAGQYRQELMQDAQSLGIDPAAIEGMRSPMLVRVMDGQDVTPDIGDRSNTASTQRLSPVEEAANDARRVDLTALQFDDSGNLSAASVRGFIQSLPVAERGDMLNPDGTPTRQAIDRITAATFKQAYGHDELVRLSAQAADPEARAIMSALAEAAPQLAALSDAGEFDVRQAVADAAVMAVNASRRGLKLADLVQNADLDMNPEAFEVARFFAENIRSSRKMAEGLKRFAQLALEQVRIAQENLQQGGMFGDRPTLSRHELLESLNNGQASDNIQQQYADSQAQRQAADAQQRGPELSGQGAEGSTPGRSGEAGGAADRREGGAGQAEEVAQDAAQQAGDARPAMFSRSKGDAAPDENERQFKDTERAYGGQAAYERAKAEGKTKLNYRQWVQVRTPAFKQWFGDWEAVRDLNAPRQAGREDAQNALEALAGKALTNNETGLVAYVNRDQRDKILSPAARSKSQGNGFDEKVHYAAASRIEQLWRHAALVGDYADQKHGDSNMRIKRFVAPLVIDGQTLYITLLAKETISNADGQRIYTLELHNETTLRSTLGNLNSQQAESTSPIRSVEQILSSLDAKVNPAEVSKVTDPETGEPLVVYHGTDADFSVFSHDELGKTTGAPSAKRGFFFSDSVEMAEWYQQYPIELIHEATGVSAQLENRAAENVWNKAARLRDELSQAKDALTGRLTQFERSLLFDGRVTGPKLVAAQREVYGPDGEFGPPDDWTRERTEAARQQLNGRLIPVRDAELSALAQRDADAASYLELKQEHDAAMQQGRFWDEKLRWSEKAHAGGTTDGETWDAKKSTLAPNTMPVFLSIRNALVHDFKGQGYRDVSYNDLLAQAQEQGKDGAMLLNTSDPTPGNVFVAFNATDIKSAIGNTGAFSPKNPDIRYSRSAMKDADANIRRGREALAKAVTEKTSVHRAMFRNGLGWVDFVWGDVGGAVRPNGSRKGERGIAHILEARQRKDGMSEQGTLRLLDDLVRTIATDKELRRRELGGSVRAVIAQGNTEAVLVKNPGSNTWMLTGWEVKPDASAVANDTRRATHNTADSSDRGVGAGKASISQNPAAGNTRYSFAGENAKTADQHALGTAQARLAAGEDAETVRQDTGWFKGVDGRWRFEIDDSKATLMPQAQRDALFDSQQKEAQQAVQQAEKALAAAQKALNGGRTTRKRRTVTEYFALNAQGLVTRVGVQPFDGAQSRTVVRYDAVPAPAEKVAQLEAAVQQAQGQLDAARKKQRDANVLTLGQVLEHRALFEAYPAVADVAVSLTVDEKLSGASGYFDPGSHPQRIVLSAPDEAQLLSGLLHEAQHAVQDVAGLSTGSSMGMFPEVSEDLRRQMQSFVNLDETARGHGLPVDQAAKMVLPPEQAQRVKELVERGQWESNVRSWQRELLSPWQRYQRTYGEMEARNVQARQRMTAEQRRATSPQQTQDIPDSDAIVVWNGYEMASLPAPANAQPLSAELARKTAALQQAVNAIHAKWANAPDTVVVADMNDARIPQAVRDADQAQRSQGAQGEPEGFYYGGKVYLVASQVQDAQAAARVMAHETLGHHGLQGLFGKRLDSVLNRIVIARNAEVKAKAKEYGLDMGRAQDRRIAAEEVLAEMAQEQPNMGLVREAIAAIRSWLREHVPGFADLQVSDDEIIRDYILPARDWVMRGRQAEAAQSQSMFSRSDSQKARILQGAPVAKLFTKDAPRGGYAQIVSHVAELFRRQGGKAHRVDIGEVLLDQRSAKSSIVHGGANVFKATAFHAVKDVLENGALVYQAQHARDGTSYYIAAPVTIDGVENMVTVLVRRDPNTQRMYLHSVMAKENLLKSGVSGADTVKGVELVGSTTSAGKAIVASTKHQGKAESAEVAREIARLLTLNVDSGTRMSRSKPATQAEQDDATPWSAPEASRFDDLIYKMQDKHIDTKRVQEAIEKVSGQIADEMNVRMAEELYHGRSAKRVQDFAQDEVEPTLKLMQHLGLSMAQVEEFLHARHAKEANALIAQRDEGMPDGGSGMSNADADAYFASLTVPERMKLEKVAEQVDAMIAGTRQLFVDYGLESKETVDGWGKQFKHYVPLMREGHEGGMGIGQGFSVKGREVKSRTGSKRKVVDILANIVMQRERVTATAVRNVASSGNA